MAPSVSGSKTCTQSVSPSLTASVLTSLLATAPENFTVAQLSQLHDALARIPGGGEPTTTIGALLK
jgi:hypothetical protein